MQDVSLLLQVGLQAARLALAYGAVQRENDHLREHEVLELLDTEYLSPRLYRGRSFHADEPYGVVRSHTKTVNKVARDQNPGSAQP